MKVVGGVEGISFVHFDERDVVRHKLVQQIVKAYEAYRWIPADAPAHGFRGDRSRDRRAGPAAARARTGAPGSARVAPGARHAARSAIAIVSGRPDPGAQPAVPPQGCEYRRLSFPAAGSRRPAGGPTPRARIGPSVWATSSLPPGVARRQARDAGHAYAAELKFWPSMACCTFWVTITTSPADRGRMARLERRLRAKGGLRRRPDRARDGPRERSIDMIPLLLFLLAVAAVYLGTIETAFSALMKLSLRLMAERGRDDRLGYYLDDPIQLFVPARLLLGLIFSLATVLLAVRHRPLRREPRVARHAARVRRRLHPRLRAPLPSVIVRRNPEAVLAALLPPFGVIARAMSPISGGLVRLLTSGRPERLITAQEQSEEDQGEVAHAYLEAGEEQGLSRATSAGCCSRSSTSATRSPAR